MLAESQTEYEPAGRASQEELLRQFTKLSADILMRSVASSSKAYISVLNTQRQMVFANDAFAEAFGTSPNDTLGLRPGELISCENSTCGPDGCGTSAACADCGAGKVLRSARFGVAADEECHIIRNDGEALDLKVSATPISVDGEEFFLFTAIDISDTKRREALERIFFHDIMNTATGVRGLSAMARTELGEDRDEILRMLEETADHLIGEIQAQRDLVAAESGELLVQLEDCDSTSILSAMVALYESHEVGSGKRITIGADSERVLFESDSTLLGRVLGNLVKNAMEATPRHGAVTVSSFMENGNVVFAVHNPTYIPRRLQNQMFRRSFTTKGHGRGLGTYGARLLAERYLRGSVSFDSTVGGGTTFRVAIPVAVVETPIDIRPFPAIDGLSLR